MIEIMEINLHNKKFGALQNSKNGEVSQKTIFHYRQKEDIIWATYEGGDIKFGTLSGSIDKNLLYFHYQHQNMQGDYKTGKCSTKIEHYNGLLRLHETWEWTSGDFSKGTSVLEELD